jgi:hypothetical protein
LKNAVFWDVTPCGSCKNRPFGGTPHDVASPKTTFFIVTAVKTSDLTSSFFLSDISSLTVIIRGLLLDHHERVPRTPEHPTENSRSQKSLN